MFKDIIELNSQLSRLSYAKTVFRWTLYRLLIILLFTFNYYSYEYDILSKIEQPADGSVHPALHDNLKCSLRRRARCNIYILVKRWAANNFSKEHLYHYESKVPELFFEYDIHPRYEVEKKIDTT
jgi:hypothetical protein